MAKNHRHPFHKVKDRDRLLPPFAEVESDVWGPLDVGDPRGMRYIVAFIERLTGHVFAQPVARKGDTVKVLDGYRRGFRKVRDSVCTQFGRDIFLGNLKADRGGEYTSSNSTVETAFDAAAKEAFNTRTFGSAGTPQSAAPAMERFWNTMAETANAHMLAAPDIPNEFKFWAIMWAIEVYNRLPTSACKSDGRGNSGCAPYSALGLDCNLQDLVPFGNRCVVHVGKRLKKDLTSRLGRIIGFAVDTPGFHRGLGRLGWQNTAYFPHHCYGTCSAVASSPDVDHGRCGGTRSSASSRITYRLCPIASPGRNFPFGIR